MPWGTLLINITGSFLLGFFLAVPTLGTGAGRALLATGFCGGYTTFSTFAFETVALEERGAWRLAVANGLLSVGALLDRGVWWRRTRRAGGEVGCRCAGRTKGKVRWAGAVSVLCVTRRLPRPN